MKKRILATILMSAMLVCSMPMLAFAAKTLPVTTEKSVFYTPGSDYVSGDCVLSSCKMMIRRAAVMHGSPKWNTITNRTLRYSATGSRSSWANTIKWNWSYSNDGLVYTIGRGKLYGKNAAQKQAEIQALLKAHPEGIVVWGARATKWWGPHGVLAVSVDGGTLYAADPQHNRGNTNVGIQSWGWTIMRTLNACTQYWYIRKVEGQSVSSPNSQKSTMAAKNVKAPVTLTEKQSFSIGGNISSNYRITSVNISIINESGKKVISKSATPYLWTYDIKSLDNDIRFGTLAPGKYKYVITVKDDKKTGVVHESKFEVLKKEPLIKLLTGKASSDGTAALAISSFNYPESIKKGKAFSIKGTVKSGSAISYVEVSVLDAAGNKVLTANANPGKKSYSVKKLDNQIRFGKLARGTYTYTVTATDASQTLTLVEQEFTVK